MVELNEKMRKRVRDRIQENAKSISNTLLYYDDGLHYNEITFLVAIQKSYTLLDEFMRRADKNG